jgi:hypothetical protein
MSELLVPVSVGELLDKITILRIKERHINVPEKLANVRAELQALKNVCQKFAIDLAMPAVEALEAINQKLWDIEDAIRAKELSKDFGAEFVELARAVYHTNDQRAAIKAQINAQTGSRYREEKSYQDYR